MSLLFNMLSRFIIAFLPRSKRLLISWLQSLPAVILQLKKIVYHCCHFPPICLSCSDGIRLGGEIWITSDMQMTSPLMIERKKELKSPLMKVKEESEKAGLKCNIQKMKIMASGPITSWQIEGEKVETGRFSFLGLQNHCIRWLQPWN